MYYPEKRNFITLIYIKFMFSLQKTNLYLHYYQQPITVDLNVLRRTTLISQTLILSEFSLHFLKFVFYDWADIHDRPLFISDFPFFLPTQAKKLVDFRPHAIRNNWIMCISQTNGASIIFS